MESGDSCLKQFLTDVIVNIGLSQLHMDLLNLIAIKGQLEFTYQNLQTKTVLFDEVVCPNVVDTNLLQSNDYIDDCSESVCFKDMINDQCDSKLNALDYDVQSGVDTVAICEQVLREYVNKDTDYLQENENHADENHAVNDDFRNTQDNPCPQASITPNPYTTHSKHDSESSVQVDHEPVINSDLTKLFKCSFCEHSTDERSDFLIHESLHRGELSYTGQETYSTSESLSKHVKSKHNAHHEDQDDSLTNAYSDEKEDPIHFSDSEEAYAGDNDAVTDTPEAELITCDQNKTATYNEFESTMNDSVMKVQLSENEYEYSSNIDKADDNCPSMAKDYKCLLCSKDFDNSINLQQHMEESHRARKNKKICAVCGLCVQNLSNHMNSHRREFQCKVCLKKFAFQRTLDLHKRIHTGDKPNTCEICGKSYSHLRTLQHHIETHDKDGAYQCKQCGKAFKTGPCYYRHVRLHNAKPFRCLLCNVEFISKYDLTEHMRRHTGEKPFGCPQCEYRTAAKNDLKRHALKHSQEWKCQCTVCGKKFRRKDNLKTHMKVHTGEKHYQCQICGQTFAYKYSLTSHETTHQIYASNL